MTNVREPGDLDDLLQPTVTDDVQRSGPLPWRLGSQFWVAFFGGSVAVTTIALLNAARLRMPRQKRWWIAIAGVLAVGLTAGVYYWLQASVEKNVNSSIRLAWRVISVALYLVLRKIQDRDDDHHLVFGGGQYASLWGPGIAVTIAGAVIQGLLFYMVKLLTA